MKNPIIESRLNKMIQKKQRLLKLKKAERGNELKETERTIATLKKWLADPATHVQTPQQEQCITGNPAGHFKDTEKTGPLTSANEALQAFAKALGTFAPDQIKTREEIREMLNREGITITGNHTEAERRSFRRHTMTDEGFIRPFTETPGNDHQNTGKTSKKPFEVDQWKQECAEKYQERFVDIETAFRRMSGRD